MSSQPLKENRDDQRRQPLARRLLHTEPARRLLHTSPGDLLLRTCTAGLLLRTSRVGVLLRTSTAGLLRVSVTPNPDSTAPDRSTAVTIGAGPGVEHHGEVEQLWHRFSHDLGRYIARRVQRPEDAEDILQTVFLRIQTKLGTVREDDRLLGWIYTLTRNTIADHYRQASTRRELSVSEIPGALHPLLDEPHDDGAAEADLAACLRPLILRLPPQQAAALELVELRGVSQVEAARQAGVSVSGMKSRVQRGRVRLREIVLDCCQVNQDVRGRVLDFAPRHCANADAAAGPCAAVPDTCCGTARLG